MASAGSIPRVLSRFGPPLAMMAVIFALSAQPDLNSGLGTLDTILRKLAHMAEYALLWFLWLRAFGYRRPALAAAIAVGYAITDELHQTTVEGRSGRAARRADRRDRRRGRVPALGAKRAAPCRPRIERAGVPPIGGSAGRSPTTGRPAQPPRRYSQPRSVAMRTAWARSTAPSLP